MSLLKWHSAKGKTVGQETQQWSSGAPSYGTRNILLNKTEIEFSRPTTNKSIFYLFIPPILTECLQCSRHYSSGCTKKNFLSWTIWIFRKVNWKQMHKNSPNTNLLHVDWMLSELNIFSTFLSACYKISFAFLWQFISCLLGWTTWDCSAINHTALSYASPDENSRSLQE